MPRLVREENLKLLKEEASVMGYERALPAAETPNVRQVLLRSRTQCELAELSYERAHQLFLTTLSTECPKILYAIGQQLSKRLLDTSRKATRLAFLDVTGRIIRTLNDLCQEPDALSHPQGTQIRVSRQELARIVG